MQLVFLETVDHSPAIQYAAHTAICTFLLDSEGICRRIVMVSGATATPRGRETARAASRCIGAQYVASLDAAASGLLADTPKVGTSMLFARTDDKGRISLVRTGHLTRFDRQVEDPFVEEERPSVVATSAPPLSPSLVPTPRRDHRSMLPPPDPYNDGERMDDRTKPIQAIRQSDIRELRRASRPDYRSEVSPESESPPTVRYQHVTPPPRRSDVAPRPGAPIAAPQKPLIRRRG